MFETTLNVDRENCHYLDYIYSRVADTILSVGGISVLDVTDTRGYLALACDKMYEKQLSDLLLDAISDVYCVGFKKEFLKQNLHLYKENFLANTLLSVMCIFDNTLDKKSIKRALCIEKNVSLEANFNFRLKSLRKKWQDITKLSNANSIALSEKNTMKEFLFFLVDAIPIVLPRLSVVLTEKGFDLFDTNNARIETAPLLSNKDNLEDGLIMNVILNKPQKIIFYGDYFRLNEDFCELTEYLFDVKVV